MAKPDKLPLNTTLDPVTLAALGFLAGREDPGRGAANVPLRRLVREELDRVMPGAWDELTTRAAEFAAGTNFRGDPMPPLTPRERVCQLVGHLRARAAR